jgi:AcrR family transcriptional regulator
VRSVPHPVDRARRPDVLTLPVARDPNGTFDPPLDVRGLGLHSCWVASVSRSTDQIAGRGTDRPETRDRILAATIELIADVGWSGITTRGVAARAGVNVALLHYHFGSKDALLREALMAAMNEVLVAVVEPLMTPGPFLDALDGVVGRLAAVDPASPAGVVTGEALVRATRDPEVRVAMSDELTEFRSLLAGRLAGATDEVRPGLDPEGTAAVLAAALDGLLIHAFVDRTLDLPRASRALRALLVERPRPTPPGSGPTPTFPAEDAR